MSTSRTTLLPSTSKLELRTAYGPVFRDVLNIPPRDCTTEEIPIIDLSPLFIRQSLNNGRIWLGRLERLL